MSDFLAAQDVKNGDIVTVIGEPTLRTATETGFDRDVYTIKIILPNGDDKDWTLNKTTYNTLFDAFGDESRDWLKRRVAIRKTRQNVRGTMRDVLYGEPYKEPQQAAKAEKAPAGTQKPADVGEYLEKLILEQMIPNQLYQPKALFALIQKQASWATEEQVGEVVSELSKKGLIQQRWQNLDFQGFLKQS